MKKILLLGAVAISSTLCFAQPANDACASAVALTIQEPEACGFVTYTNLDATHEAPQPNCDVEDIASVWFKVTTNANETEMTIKINNIETSWLVMDIFTQCGGTPATGLSTNCITQATNINASITGFSPSTTYYIRVGNLPFYDDVQGTFEICITKFAPEPPPANDLCAGAINVLVVADTLSCTPTLLTMESATLTEGGPHCTTGTEPDIWFKFNSGLNDNIYPRVHAPDLNQTAGGGMNSLFTVYSACGVKDVGLSGQCTGDTIKGFANNTDYWLKITIPTGWVSIKLELCMIGYSTVGITENYFSTALQVAPNPAKDVVSISVDGASSFNMELFDLTGRLVLAETVLANSKTFDVSTFEKGMYMVKASTDSYTLTQRLIIE